MTTTKGQPQPHIMHLHVSPKTQLPMTTTEGQPQPHIMNLHVNPKTQLPMTTTEGQPQPHIMHLHAHPKDMVSHKSCCSNLRPKTRPKRCPSYKSV